MTMPYPDHQTYSRLYARFLGGCRTEEMVSMAGILKGKTVADLCGGGGRLSKVALDQGAHVTLVDESAAMITDAPSDITTICCDIKQWVTNTPANQFDVLFCQQAINYWFNFWFTNPLADIIKTDGMFIFNTFNRKPSRIPSIREYTMDEGQTHFAEASWIADDDMVHHVQMREGDPPHTTQFKWISPEQFRDWLEPRFRTHEVRYQATSIWVCQIR